VGVGATVADLTDEVVTRRPRPDRLPFSADRRHPNGLTRGNELDV